jgi:hypothetical protein
MMRKVAAGLEEFANSECLDPAGVRRALEDARMLIAKYGLTSMEVVDAKFDPARAAGIVWHRGASELGELDDGDRRPVNLAIEAIYRGLLADPDTFPELAREFQRAVLDRLDKVADLPELTRQMLARAAAGRLLIDPLRWWRPDRYPISSLLRAEYSVVPFEGREDMLEDIEAWASDSPAVALRVYHGVGGIGKTRLLIEACRMLRGQGWAAGFLGPDISEVTDETLIAAVSGHQGEFIVVDYAETRTAAVASLLAAALNAERKIRVVLLARSVTGWWYGLASGQVGDFLLGPAATRQPVPPLARDEPARRELFEHAAHRYAEVLNVEFSAEPGQTELVLRDVIYDRVLFVHLRALAATQSVDADGERGLLDFALAREQRFWDDGLHAFGHPELAGRPIRQAAAVITLAGSAQTFEAAVSLLAQAPLLAGQPAAVIGQIADLFHRLYPAPEWLAGIQPDLLGEHLVARAVEDDFSLLGVVRGA